MLPSIVYPPIFESFRIILEQKETPPDEKLMEFCENLYSDKKTRSPYLLAFIVDILGEKIEKGDDAEAELHLKRAVQV